jgi:hypothetical protein
VLQPINQHLQAGGEALVAVVEPDVLAEGDKGWEAVGGSERKNWWSWVPDGGVADALFVDRGWGGADGKADGVVDQQGEGKAGLAVGEPGGLQRCQQRLGQGQGVGAQRVAGLEDGGDPGVGLQDLTQPVGQDL